MTKTLTAQEALNDKSQARAIITKRDKDGKPFQYVIAGDSLEAVKNEVHEQISGEQDGKVLVEYEERGYVSRGSKLHDFT